MPVTQPATVYYVRHAENEANVSGVFSHRHIDLDLTDTGREQARQVAEFLAGERLGEGPVFTSPLRRAIQTATVIGERLGRQLEIIEEFRELDVGDLEGQAGAQAVEYWWSVLHAWAGGDRENRFAGGESHVELTTRLKAGFGRIAAFAPTGPCVLVAHAGIMRAGIGSFVHPAPPTDLAIPNCSVSRMEIDWEAGSYAFDYLARCEFLAQHTASHRA